MNSEKILYWVALGALALGMNQEYRNGGFPAAHRALDSAGNTVCHLVTRAEQTFAMAKFIVNPPAGPADAVLANADFSQEQVEMIQDQAREQAEMIRQQAQDQAEIVRDQIQAQAETLRVRAEMHRARFEQLRQLRESKFHFTRATTRHMTVVCPVTGQRVVVDTDPDQIEVSDNF